VFSDDYPDQQQAYSRFGLNLPPTKGYKHAFTAICLIRPLFSRSMVCKTTVQAPQPPSPQPNFVPFVPCCDLMKSSKVHSGSGLGSSIFVPFMKKWRVDSVNSDSIKFWSFWKGSGTSGRRGAKGKAIIDKVSDTRNKDSGSYR